MTGQDFSLEAWQIRLVLPHRPPILQLDRIDRCAAALDMVEASKAVGGSDPMMLCGPAAPACLSPGAMIEGLAQCCGLLVRLRWLGDQGADLIAFAAGGASLAAYDIPRSVLAESNARFSGQPRPGSMIRFSAKHELSRGDMHRFTGSVSSGTAETAAAQIMLKFPFQSLPG